eukprot:GHVP01020699.1.p1 GENE.GHVP01020699.1~~GHVP01020699.1.p1  ORF type:complete len:272 (+),score=47.17 GHVP01020699.1:23-817(+)
MSKKSEVKGGFASAVLTAVGGCLTNLTLSDTPEAPPLCSSQSENLDFANSKLSFLGGDQGPQNPVQPSVYLFHSQQILSAVLVVDSNIPQDDLNCGHECTLDKVNDFCSLMKSKFPTIQNDKLSLQLKELLNFYQVGIQDPQAPQAHQAGNLRLYGYQRKPGHSGLEYPTTIAMTMNMEETIGSIIYLFDGGTIKATIFETAKHPNLKALIQERLPALKNGAPQNFLNYVQGQSVPATSGQYNGNVVDSFAENSEETGEESLDF